jgi:hypothetical protein
MQQQEMRYRRLVPAEGVNFHMHKLIQTGKSAEVHNAVDPSYLPSYFHLFKATVSPMPAAILSPENPDVECGTASAAPLHPDSKDVPEKMAVTTSARRKQTAGSKVPRTAAAGKISFGDACRLSSTLNTVILVPFSAAAR